MKRSSGILLPVFSLPNIYGIGSFGKEAYNFIDYLKENAQSVWQVLPLVQTGYGDSPYSSVCSYSFNPYYIDLDTLCEEKLLEKEEILTSVNESEYIDYGFLYNVRYSLLRKAFSRFDKNDLQFTKFIKKGSFYDYVLFSAIKTVKNNAPLCEWEDGLKHRDKNELNKFYNENKEEVLFWQFVQFKAESEWKKLKRYANKNGIEIMGDMPLYVSGDSVDVWVNPELFKLDGDLRPVKVAGVPPDYFSKTGQLWGNPVYNYIEHQKKNFSWWKKRIKTALSTFDYVRIDHFRGFDRFYEIDSGEQTAVNGKWIDVPSRELFDVINGSLDGKRIIAEDLGIIDDGVRELLSYTGYPGMKILSFAFNGEKDNLYLPENINENSVCYTGTHDNDTLTGLIDNFSEWDYNNLKIGVNESLKIFGLKSAETKEELFRSVIELGFNSKANLFILPMQDVYALGSNYRINVPGAVSSRNWAVKFKKTDFNNKKIDIKQMTVNSGRGYKGE